MTTSNGRVYKIGELVSDQTFWYIIQVYSGHEKKVVTNLQLRAKAVGLEHELLQVVVPTREVTKIKGGKRHTVEQPSYPGYILVQLAHELQIDSTYIDVQNSWNAIRETSGVMGFVGSSTNPAPLSIEEVNTILSIGGEEIHKDAVDLPFASGDTVRVNEGPFEGFPASVNAVDAERQRLYLTITIFGRDTPIDLDFTEVERV